MLPAPSCERIFERNEEHGIRMAAIPDNGSLDADRLALTARVAARKPRVKDGARMAGTASRLAGRHSTMPLISPIPTTDAMLRKR